MAEQRRRNRFVTGDDELDAGISELAAIVGGADRRIGELGRQMITTVAKMMLERASVGDLKLVNSALKELRWAFMVFGTTREAR